MLLRHIRTSYISMNSSQNIDIIIKYSPQAQAVGTSIQKKKRASCSASLRKSLHNRGSATVEAALILPLFLCALCFLIMLGQLLLIEGEICHALSKTAMSMASQESVKEVGKKGMPGAENLSANAAFYSVLQADDLCKDCIAGGKHGILVSTRIDKEEERVLVTARYILKVPVPFFGGARIAREMQMKRRIYSGYFPHGGGSNGDNRLVFLTDHASVYHTSLSCSHISLRISANDLSVKALKAKGIRPCEKCIKRSSNPEAYYITAEGDCYHSSLNCSGLKRSIHTATMSEVGGIRPCSRCAK